jgi:hypothetical protein
MSVELLVLQVVSILFLMCISVCMCHHGGNDCHISCVIRMFLLRVGPSSAFDVLPQALVPQMLVLPLAALYDTQSVGIQSILKL